jgi:hypothetical protein
MTSRSSKTEEVRESLLYIVNLEYIAIIGVCCVAFLVACSASLVQTLPTSSDKN